MEEAANELINMLLEFDHNQREEVEKVEEESCAESKTIDSEGILTFSFLNSNNIDYDYNVMEQTRIEEVDIK